MSGRIPAAIWESLVAETQFATELTLTGLRRLCSVPAGPDLSPWNNNDLNFALHVGMYAYSSGLERLCKLAIACNGYATTGEFPSLRRYSHRIGSLLDAVGELVPPPSGHGLTDRDVKYLVRPVDQLDPDLVEMVQRFANGAGRYEHLDSLWNDNAEVNTLNEWTALADRTSVSEEVLRLISLKTAMSEAIGEELIEAGLESSAQTIMEDLELPIFVPSVGVVISLFRKIRWVSTHLEVATDYTRGDPPILGEIVGPTFIHSSTDFFNFHIARFSDDEVVEEEVHEALGRIHAREAEEQGEDDDEGEDDEFLDQKEG
ncbi:UNVERIFIED_CONTAM: hypothetical protein ABIE34_000621 [Jeotgalibacillus campisalis]